MSVVAAFTRTNLALLVVFSVALVAWCYFYTGWWGPVSVVVGGGGLYGAGTFVWKLLPEEWKTQVRNWTLEQVRQPMTGIRVLLVCLNAVVGLTLAVTFCVGTVAVKSLQKDPVRIQFLRQGKESKPRVLNLNESVRRVFLAAWVSRAAVSVRAEDLPDYQFPRIRPWRREDLVLPDGFLKRPLVLVMPGPQLACEESTVCHVVVKRHPKDSAVWTVVKEFDFNGGEFWVGCEGSVRVPSRTAQQLGAALREPVPQCRVPAGLNEGDHIQMSVSNKGEIIGCVDFPVGKAGLGDESPNLVWLDQGWQC